MNRTFLALPLAMLLLGGCGKPADMPVEKRACRERASERCKRRNALRASVGSGWRGFCSCCHECPIIAPTIDDHSDVNASIDKLFGDHARYQAVIEACRKAVAEGDKAAVAAPVDYPIEVDLGGSMTTIRDPATLARDYDRIVTPAIARTIAAQEYSELMVNSKGVMFGNGETWINGVCREGSAGCSEFEVKVVAIQAGASD